MKYILAILLTILALTATASTDLQQLLKDRPIEHLAEGITIAPAYPLNDFSNIKSGDYKPISLLNPIQSSEPIYTIYLNWYHYDFTEDPFDGRIDIPVIGEPLPSMPATIFIMAGIVGIIYWYRFKSVQKVTI